MKELAIVKRNSRERTQNRRIDPSLMDLVKTVATDLTDNDPCVVPQLAMINHVDLANSTANTTDPQPNGAPLSNAFRATSAASTVERRPRERLTKMNVWFTQDDITLIKKISALRGQKPEGLIQLATLKLLAELGVVGEERKRLLIPVRG